MIGITGLAALESRPQTLDLSSSFLVRLTQEYQGHYKTWTVDYGLDSWLLKWSVLVVELVHEGMGVGDPQSHGNRSFLVSHMCRPDL